MIQESHVSDPVIIFDFLDLRSGRNSEPLRWRVRDELRNSAARQGLAPIYSLAYEHEILMSSG